MDYTLDNMVKCVCESMGLTGKSDHSLQEHNTLVCSNLSIEVVHKLNMRWSACSIGFNSGSEVSTNIQTHTLPASPAPIYVDLSCTTHTDPWF